MDPGLILICVALSFAGSCMGAFSGIVPGIHVNTLASVLLAAYPAIESVLEPAAGAYGASVAVCCCIMSASVVHSFLDFVPSVFIGAPDSEDCISVLPGHRLLLQGRGMEAVRAALADHELPALHVRRLTAAFADTDFAKLLRLAPDGTGAKCIYGDGDPNEIILPLDD